MAKESENWANFLSSKFIDSHRNQITLPPTNVWPSVYEDLESLLYLLRDNTVLDIVDFYRSDVIENLQYIRNRKFGGSWFDSLETLIADNVQYDDEHLKKLRRQESKLKTENNFVCDWLKMLSARLQKTDDLTGEHAEILRYRVKWFKRQRKLVESELANHMEKMKAVSDARKSLDFFYPT